MKLKSAPAQFKAAGDTDATTLEGGQFEAIVSVFNNVDSWGDVVLPGAFKESLTKWKASGDSLPVLWSHRMDDPTFNIGTVLDIDELEPGDARMPDWVDPFVKANGGLWVRAQIDTGPDASPIATQALRLLKSRRVTQFSYAYDEIDGAWVKAGGAEAWGLSKVHLWEVSPTQVGANTLTQLLVAKGARPDIDGDAKRGTVKQREEPETVKRGEEPAKLDGLRLQIDLLHTECTVID